MSALTVPKTRPPSHAEFTQKQRSTPGRGNIFTVAGNQSCSYVFKVLHNERKEAQELYPFSGLADSASRHSISISISISMSMSMSVYVYV